MRVQQIKETKMGNLFYNAKFKTKQIFDITAAPSESPEVNEIFYWLTYENGNLYANYKIYGIAETQRFQITDPQSFNPTQVFENKVKSIEYDDTIHAIEYEDENTSYTVPLTGLLSNAILSGNTLTFKKSGQNEQDIVLNLSSLGKHVSSASVNTQTKTLTLNYSDGTTYPINLSSLLSYSGGSTETASVSINNSNTVTASVKISSQSGNQIQQKSDGLFVPVASEIDTSSFATKSDLNDKVDKVEGKGLSTNDFTNSLKSKLESISPSGIPSSKISFTKSTNNSQMYWSGNVGYFTHTLNCMPIVTFYDSQGKTVLVEAIATSANSFTADFENKQSVEGTWTCIINYGGSFESI